MKLDRIIAVRNNKTVYRDGDLCMKVFNKDFSKSDILNEALNHSRVEDMGLKVPKIREITVIDGKWTIVTEFIKGKTIDRLISENKEKAHEYISMLVSLQNEMHSRTCPLLNNLTDKMTREIDKTELSDELKHSFKNRLSKMPKHNKLCHCDFTPSNIIISEANEAYLLDWSHAAVGNASADAAMTYLRFVLSGDKRLSQDYLDLFCKKSGIDIEYVTEWIPIAAAAQLVRSNCANRKILTAFTEDIR